MRHRACGAATGANEHQRRSGAAHFLTLHFIRTARGGRVAKLTLTIPEQSQNIQGVAVIKAPLEKVFEAYTNADLFKQWFARGHDATVHEFDARSGGAWHLTERSAEGEYSFGGSYHEVAKNERIILDVRVPGPA